MAVNQEFWKGKRVLITGHTGFKGGWLSLWLQAIGAIVTGYALPPPTKPSLFEVADIASGMDSVKGDVRELDSVRSAIIQHQPDIVIHMAAQSLVGESYDRPVETFSTNVLGTVNVLEALKGHVSTRVMINVTSDKCYENQEQLKVYREGDPLGGHDPYSSSKACAEIVTTAYRKSFFHEPGRLAVATVRAGNVIGGGDWAKDRLVPDIVDALRRQISPVIRNPTAIRPWQHVLDPLHGYLLLAEKLWVDGVTYSDAWNFGPESIENRSVSWVVDELCRRWNGNVHWQQDVVAHEHEAHTLCLDATKARTQLSWRPKLSLERALDWIVEWHKTYEQGKCMRDFTMAQIRQFQETAIA